MIISKSTIESFEQRVRASFVNSLSGFRQTVLVGTKSVDTISNLAVFNSLIHLGSHPALFGLINRPDSVQRDTLENILATRVYTLNYVQASCYQMAHQTSARYPRGVSEFDQVGFNETYLPDCYAPFVAGAVIKIAMQLEQTLPITLNGTVMIIGSIMQVELDDSIVGKDGFVNLSKEEVLISQGLDAYFITKEIGRLPYAKP